MMITTKLGMEFVQFGPKGHQLSEQMQAIGRANCKASGGRFGVTDVMEDAFRDADFVYTDTATGEKIVEDAKGFRDPHSATYQVFVIKRKLMRHVHGIKILET